MKSIKIASFLTERKTKVKPIEANKSNLQRIKKIDFDGNIFLAPTQTNTDMILIKKGDLVISGINVEKGALAIYHGDEDILASIHYSAYEFDEKQIDITYLKWFLKSKIFRRLLVEQNGSGIKKEIKSKHLLPMQIRLPSLEIQQKIAQYIIAVQHDIVYLNNEISKQEKYVCSLRQAILCQAVEGKLCEQDSTDEPTSMLLEKIQAEKEKMVAKKRNKKLSELKSITEEEKPFDLPQGWVWCRVEQLLKELPRNGFSPNRVDYPTATRVLTLTATTSGILDLQQYKYIEDIIEDSSFLWIKQGDILIQRSNSAEYVGTACLCDVPINGYIYPDLMMKLQFLHGIDLNFAIIFLHSTYSRKYFQSKANGTSDSMKKITQKIVGNVVFPLPPLAEQQRIVQKVDRLMDLCNELEQEVKNAKKYASQLMETILQEAFGSKTESKQTNVIEFTTKKPAKHPLMAAARGNMREDTWERLANEAIKLANEEN